MSEIKLLKKVGSNKHRQAIWLCECFCGNTFETLKSSIASGNTKSCGCLKESYIRSLKKPKHDYTNEKFGQLTAIKFQERAGVQNIWKFKCDCGKIHYADMKSVKFGSIRSCGCSKTFAASNKVVNIAGQKFGRLTVIKKVEVEKRGAYWECKCECGNIKVIKGVYLRQKLNPVRSCGCMQRDAARKNSFDLTGEKFGRLLVVGKIEKEKHRENYWKCDCECGGSIETTTNLLRRGKAKSCGCLKIERREDAGRNLTGFLFGSWTVLEKSRSKNSVSYWKCKCACGVIKDVNTQSLINGLSQSCGCAGREFEWNKIVDSFAHSNFEDLESAEKRKLIYRVKRQIRGSLRRGFSYVDTKKKNATFELLGFSAEDLIEHIESQFQEGMSWKNYGDWHIDHIIPLAVATNLDDLIELNQLENLQPLWAIDNLKKNRY